jgi:hypothetical protein
LHLGAVVGGEADRLRDVGNRAESAGREHLERHDLRAEGYAGDPDAVVRRLGDGTGDVGAVAVVVERILVAVDEVVAGDELGVPQVGNPLEAPIAIAVGHPGIDHGDDHALAGGFAPGRGRVDLPHVPLVAVLGVIGEGVVGGERRGVEARARFLERRDAVERVELGVLHRGIGAQSRAQGGQLPRGLQRRPVEPLGPGEAAVGAEAEPVATLQLGHLVGLEVIAQVEQQLVGHAARTRGVARWRGPIGIGDRFATADDPEIDQHQQQEQENPQPFLPSHVIAPLSGRPTPGKGPRPAPRSSYAGHFRALPRPT